MSGHGSQVEARPSTLVSDSSVHFRPRAPGIITANGMAARQLAWDEIPWHELDGLPDRSYAQTQASLQYLKELTNGDPFIVELSRDGETVGWFTGMRTSRLGLKMIGSPLPGWSTPYMGFNLLPDHSRREALIALTEFAWRSGANHLEVIDRFLTEDDYRDLGFQPGMFRTYMTDLRRSDDELFAAMTSACRRAIRKAEKSGITITEARPEGFASLYYGQLEDIFERQGLRPTYDQRRVELLIKHLWPSGNMLLLKAYDPDGDCLATGIFLGCGRYSYFWGNASQADNRQQRPNEAMHWYVLRYWRDRGMEWHDWGGEMKYKLKYGVTPLEVPRIYKSRPQLLMNARDYASRAYFGFRKTRQKLIRRFSS